MDKIIEALLGITISDEARWALEEAIDEYIDKRIADALDQEFDRGAYRRD